MNNIGITGGTGFIGRHITALLTDKGYNVVIFSRTPSRKTERQVSYALWNPDKEVVDQAALKDLDGVIHLAGAGVAEKRLTEKRKKEIIDSRVKSTEFLLAQLKAHAPNCKTLIAASATGFYGPDRDDGKPFIESAPPHNDFLGSTCQQWEAATQKGNAFLRIVIIRIGIVLGKDGGAFPEFAKPMFMGVMPILGSGKQVVSFIEIDDLARLFVFALENAQLSGIYNGVAPHPVTHTQLMKTISKEKGGFKIPIPVPAFVLKIVLGEMSVEVLKSCTVSADKVVKAGFTFNYPEIAGAVKELCRK